MLPGKEQSSLPFFFSFRQIATKQTRKCFGTKRSQSQKKSGLEFVSLETRENCSRSNSEKENNKKKEDSSDFSSSAGFSFFCFSVPASFCFPRKTQKKMPRSILFSFFPPHNCRQKNSKLIVTQTFVTSLFFFFTIEDHTKKSCGNNNYPPESVVCIKKYKTK